MTFRKITTLLFSLLALLLAVNVAAQDSPTVAADQSARASLQFVQNEGQFAEPVEFKILGLEYPAWLTADSLWLALVDREQEQSTAIRLRFAEADGATTLHPFARQSVRMNYLGGGRYPAVPVWGGVRLEGLGESGSIELNGAGNRLLLEATAPFTLELEGATIVAVNETSATLETALGRRTVNLPLAGREWALRGVDAAGRSVEHSVAAASAPVVEPVMKQVTAGGGLQIAYSTLLGGELLDRANTIALGPDDSAYVSGHTESLEFPTEPGVLSGLHGVDIYVAKLLPDGSDMAYLTWVNPNPDQPDDEDYGSALVVNEAGEAHLTGRSLSPVFCEFLGLPPGYDTTYNGNSDAIIIKFTADGSALEFCTFVGGAESDIANAIALDDDGNIYIAGSTWSEDFPVTDGVYSETLAGLRDSFVAKLDPTGMNLLYGTYIGAVSNQEEITGIALDADRNLYATGWTNSDDFPVTPGAFQSNYNGIFDAFALKLSADASTLDYATYLGGSTEDRGWAVVVDDSGRAAITGQTLSADFPTTAGAFDEEHNGSYDAFLTLINEDGTELVSSTFLGGDGSDIARGLALSDNGFVYITGETSSSNFPLSPDALDSTLDGDVDVFVTHLSFTGTLDYSTFLGGSIWDYGQGIAVNSLGCVYLSGRTLSPDFPTTAGAYDTELNGDYDIFITSLTPNGQICAEVVEHFLYLPVMLKP